MFWENILYFSHTHSCPVKTAEHLSYPTCSVSFTITRRNKEDHEHLFYLPPSKRNYKWIKQVAKRPKETIGAYRRLGFLKLKARAFYEKKMAKSQRWKDV